MGQYYLSLLHGLIEVIFQFLKKRRGKPPRKGGVTPNDCIPSDIGTAPSNSDKVLYWYLRYLTRHLFGLFALIVKTQQDHRQNDRETAPHLGRDKPLLTKRGWHVNKRRHKKRSLSLDCMCLFCLIGLLHDMSQNATAIQRSWFKSLYYRNLKLLQVYDATTAHSTYYLTQR